MFIESLNLTAAACCKRLKGLSIYIYVHMSICICTLTHNYEDHDLSVTSTVLEQRP